MVDTDEHCVCNVRSMKQTHHTFSIGYALTLLLVGPFLVACGDPAASATPDTFTDTSTDIGTDTTADVVQDMPQDTAGDTAPATDVDTSPDVADGNADVDVAVVDTNVTDLVDAGDPDVVETSDGGDGSDISDAPDTADVPVTPPVFLNSYPIESQYPESGFYDSVDHAFYVGSLADGSVHRIDATTGDETILFMPTDGGSYWTLGMAVDEEERLLWVCAMDDTKTGDQPYDGYVWVFDLLTNERIANHDLSDAITDAACSDVAIADSGKAYVSDRENPNVYEVDVDTGATLFATGDDLSGAFVGQNALIVLPDQSALLVIVYLNSKLVRVDLTTGAVKEVDIDGSFFDATALSGADGMAYSDGSVYVVFSSELVRVSPTLGDWSTASADEVTVPKGMTDVVSTPNGLYLLNGQAINYALGTSTDPFVLNRYLGGL